MNRLDSTQHCKIMRISVCIAATLLLLIQYPSTSKAWTIQSQFIKVSPTIPTYHISSSLLPLRRRAKGERIHTQKSSKLEAIKNKQSPFSESSVGNIAGAGLLNRTNDGGHDEKGETVNSTNARTRKIRSCSSYELNNNIQSDDDDELSSKLLATTIIAALAVGAAVGISSSQGGDFSPSTLFLTGSNFLGATREVLQDPGTALDNVVELTDSMGELGIVYFGIAYCIAEILAIPAIPLTASAGYLFGPVQGTGIVLLSASIAAAISFTIGRTLLRDYVENLLKDYPKFAKLDRAIGREGFKLMLLLRLSPIFPFALSNYLYGASSINFTAFFGGTLLGFAPGTIAYVYTGYVGKALTMTVEEGGSDVYPWYVYIGGLSLFAGLLKIVADTATRVVEEIEAEEEEAANAQSNDVFL
mmetsp:Transcript_58131/g.65062  ORF Transcript_58131/g.65062 Transcript_58131/m.65062 type:complete len:416 (+) Transcript_58131:203-1450(+)